MVRLWVSAVENNANLGSCHCLQQKYLDGSVGFLGALWPYESAVFFIQTDPQLQRPLNCSNTQRWDSNSSTTQYHLCLLRSNMLLDVFWISIGHRLRSKKCCGFYFETVSKAIGMDLWNHCGVSKTRCKIVAGTNKVVQSMSPVSTILSSRKGNKNRNWEIWFVAIASNQTLHSAPYQASFEAHCAASQITKQITPIRESQGPCGETSEKWEWNLLSTQQTPS